MFSKKPIRLDVELADNGCVVIGNGHEPEFKRLFAIVKKMLKVPEEKEAKGYQHGDVTHTNPAPKSPAPTSRMTPPDHPHSMCGKCAICGNTLISFQGKVSCGCEKFDFSNWTANFHEKGESKMPERSFIQQSGRRYGESLLAKSYQDYWENINKGKSMSSIKVEKNVNELNEIIASCENKIINAKELVAEIKEINDYSVTLQDKPKPKKMAKIRLNTIKQLLADGAVFCNDGKLVHPTKSNSVSVDAKNLVHLGKTFDCTSKTGSLYDGSNGTKWFWDEVAEVIYE